MFTIYYLGAKINRKSLPEELLKLENNNKNVRNAREINFSSENINVEKTFIFACTSLSNRRMFVCFYGCPPEGRKVGIPSFKDFALCPGLVLVTPPSRQSD